MGKGSMSLAEGHSPSVHSLPVPAPHCPVPRGPQPTPTPSSSLVLLWELSWGRAGGMGPGTRDGTGGRAQAWHLAPLLMQLGTQSWPVLVLLLCCPQSPRGAPCPHPAGAAVTIHPATRESRSKVQIYETMEQSQPLTCMSRCLQQPRLWLGCRGQPLWIPVLVTWDNVDISKHLCEAFINTCTHAHTPELYMHSHTHTHTF